MSKCMWFTSSAKSHCLSEMAVVAASLAYFVYYKKQSMFKPFSVNTNMLLPEGFLISAPLGINTYHSLGRFVNNAENQVTMNQLNNTVSWGH
jgi:hypothetical protein